MSRLDPPRPSWSHNRWHLGQSSPSGSTAARRTEAGRRRIRFERPSGPRTTRRSQSCSPTSRSASSSRVGWITTSLRPRCATPRCKVPMRCTWSTTAAPTTPLLVAEAAGAIVAEVYKTEAFDGRLAQALMNAVVARESLRTRASHVWWLYLDSDEFPEGPGGQSIREYLATLDQRFRIVGSTPLNHVPDAKPEYLAGYHPIDFQPLFYTFEPVRQPPCHLGHWKHPLQRTDRFGHFVLSNPGAHTAICSESLVEPSQGIVTHHFQYRDEELTRAKLELTCGPGSRRTELYASRWPWRIRPPNAFPRRRLRRPVGRGRHRSHPRSIRRTPSQAMDRHGIGTPVVLLVRGRVDPFPMGEHPNECGKGDVAGMNFAHMVERLRRQPVQPRARYRGLGPARSIGSQTQPASAPTHSPSCHFS